MMSTTNFSLAEMTADDFETARSAGYSFRRELTHTVMVALRLPDNWDILGEYGSEFGGLFPVQVRFAPTHGLFQMVLCSPGEASDQWLLLMMSGKGHHVVCVRQCDYFNVSELNHALSVADVRHREGYIPSDIIAFLKHEVKL